MAVADTIDWVGVRNGALGVLMFVAPAYVIARVGASGDELSSWWLVLPAALLFGSTFGGFAGARDRPATPMIHGALSAGLGLCIVFGAALAWRALKGDLTLAATLTALVMVQIGTALGCLGGRLAARWFGAGAR